MTYAVSKATYVLIEYSFSGERAIYCKVCGMTSYNKNDVDNRYCGNCHTYHHDTYTTTAHDGSGVQGV